MIESVQDVGGIPTKCVAFERAIGSDLSDVKILVLLIPGNPGIVEFYYEFLSSLCADLKQRFPEEVIPIWAVSHAGHDTEALQGQLPPLEANTDVYSLRGQICHKAKFIDLYVPGHVQVILIGHSIGCFIGQELLKAKSIFSTQVTQFFLLFPTIMQMKESPNGQFFVATQALQWLLLSALFSADFLPQFIRRLVVRFYMWLNYPQASTSAHEAILTLIRKHTFEKVLVMGNSEMAQVIDLDVTFLQSNTHRLFAYFGASDGWCPLDFVTTMTSKIPKLPHILCQEGIEHAFVLSKSRRMAEILMSYINPSP